MSISLTITEHGLDQIHTRIMDYSKKVKKGISKATGKLAHDLRKQIVTGIRKQAPAGIQFKPLRPATIKKKGSSKALIDHGDLIRSINVTKLGDLAYFVGVNRSVMAKNGKPMVNIAEVHEFGTKDGRIPARPYLRPTWRVWSHFAEEEWVKLVAKEIGVPVSIARKAAGKLVVGGD